eukprot:3553196-Pyramimonas_sp.AAC.1
MASLKLRVPGGKAVLFTAYAPHSGKPFEQRHTFFHDLAEFVESTSAHGPKLAFGDLNAKLFRRLDGEHSVVGPHVLLCPQGGLQGGRQQTLARGDVHASENVFGEHIL